MLVYPTICLFIAVRSEILLRILIISFQCVRLGLASDLYHYFLLFSSVIFFCSHFFFSLLFSLLLPLLFVLARFVHVVISSLLTSILPPFPPMVAKSRHTPIIHRSQSEVRGQRELARVLLTSVCVLVGTMMVMGLLFYFIQTQTRLYAFLVYALLT